MSDNDTKSTGKGWTDKERLVYLFALIDNAGGKFDYINTPRPAGRTVIACQRMVERLKGTLKNELEALKNGTPIEEGATPKKSPMKRKPKGDANGTPTKRGRKKKVDVEAEAEAEVEDGEESGVKVEVKDELDEEIEAEI